MIKNTMVVTLVRKADGSIDSNASLEAAIVKLGRVTSKESRLLAKEAVLREDIAKHVATVWEERPEVSQINVDFFLHLVMAKMSVEGAESYTKARGRILDYLRSTPTLYLVVRGKGGGVLCAARISAERLARLQA